MFSQPVLVSASAASKFYVLGAVVVWIRLDSLRRGHCGCVGQGACLGHHHGPHHSQCDAPTHSQVDVTPGVGCAEVGAFAWVVTQSNESVAGDRQSQ